MSKRFATVLLAGVLFAGAAAAQPDGMGPGYGGGWGPGYGMGPGYGQGWGMGPGMMGGYGPGWGGGPGAGGYGPGWGMGPGMGGYGPGYGRGMGGYGPGWGMGPGMMGGWGPGGGAWGRGGLEQLDLSADQRRKIGEIRSETAKAMWSLMGTMHEQADRFNGAGPLDEDAARKAFDAMSEARKGMFELQLQARKRIEGVLTPEQREKLRQGG